jgi:hypothetical protein
VITYRAPDVLVELEVRSTAISPHSFTTPAPRLRTGARLRLILTPGQTDMDTLMAPYILPTFSVASFMAKGAALEGAALTHPGPLALIELPNGPNAPSYVAGTENFYAITRYNWSSY